MVGLGANVHEDAREAVDGGALFLPKVRGHVHLLGELDGRVELLLAAGLHVEDEAVQLHVEHGRQLQESDAPRSVALGVAALTEVLVVALQLLLLGVVLEAV